MTHHIRASPFRFGNSRVAERASRLGRLVNLSSSDWMQPGIYLVCSCLTLSRNTCPTIAKLIELILSNVS
jgi:hypothetical protein